MHLISLYTVYVNPFDRSRGWIKIDSEEAKIENRRCSYFGA